MRGDDRLVLNGDAHFEDVRLAAVARLSDKQIDLAIAIARRRDVLPDLDDSLFQVKSERLAERSQVRHDSVADDVGMRLESVIVIASSCDRQNRRVERRAHAGTA